MESSHKNFYQREFFCHNIGRLDFQPFDGVREGTRAHKTAGNRAYNIGCLSDRWEEYFKDFSVYVNILFKQDIFKDPPNL